MKTGRSAFIVATAFVIFAGAASAATVSINFDTDQAGYVAGTPGTEQALSNQFGSLGILFADTENGTAASVGDCGPGSSNPFHLYGGIGQGTSFSGCGDTTPGLTLTFVDPVNNANAGFTTSFSISNSDGGVELTAFDFGGNLLGSTTNTSGILSLAGIGQISSVTLFSTDDDPTTLDDLTFETVQALNVTTIPLPAGLPLLLTGLGGVLLLRRRKA